MKALIDKALAETAALWPDIERACAWAARLGRALKNEAGESGAAVRRRVAGILGAIARHRAKAPDLEDALEHLLKVTRSYWSGLFHCYDIPGLDRTNNALEQAFGKWRRHQRRCTGCKTAARATVLRGPVSMVAAFVTQEELQTAQMLSQTDKAAWKECRKLLQERRIQRVLGSRFRRNPDSYLQNLEEKAIKLNMPT